ncbi:MAG: hypothetical protein ABIF01_01840 [Candidatus Micrarchaeota archaeon]
MQTNLLQNISSIRRSAPDSAMRSNHPFSMPIGPKDFVTIASRSDSGTKAVTVAPALAPRAFMEKLLGGDSITRILVPEHTFSSPTKMKITYYAGNIVGKEGIHDTKVRPFRLPLPEILDVATRFLADGFGREVPVFGFVDEGNDRVTILSSRVYGPNLQDLLSYGQPQLSPQAKENIWYRYGKLEGRFFESGIAVHQSSNQHQPINYMLGVDSRDSGVAELIPRLENRKTSAELMQQLLFSPEARAMLFMIDIDSVQTKLCPQVSAEKFLEFVRDRIDTIGADMKERDFDSYVRGVLSGWAGGELDANDKAVRELVDALRRNWSESPALRERIAGGTEFLGPEY